MCCYRNASINHTFCYRSLLNFTNTSTIHKTIDMINASGDIINAIKEADAAANKANKAADHALAVSATVQNNFYQYNSFVYNVAKPFI